MCTGVEVSDCQEANHVNYCYCKGNLCNADIQKITTTTTITPDTDDEDLSSEGSGDELPQTTTNPPQTTQKKPEVIHAHAAASQITASGLLMLIIWTAH